MLRLINPAVLYDSHGETNHGNRMILCLYFVELFVWQYTVRWVILLCNKLHGIAIMSFREVIQAKYYFPRNWDSIGVLQDAHISYHSLSPLTFNGIEKCIIFTW